MAATRLREGAILFLFASIVSRMVVRAGRTSSPKHFALLSRI